MTDGIEVFVIRVKIAELKPGMTLAEPVYNQSGSLLLDEDTSLTKRRIWMLKTWGIDTVSLKGNKPDPETKTAIEAELEAKKAIEKELKAKFKDTIDDPVMETIMKAAARQLQKSLSDPDAQRKPR